MKSRIHTNKSTAAKRLERDGLRGVDKRPPAVESNQARAVRPRGPPFYTFPAVDSCSAFGIPTVGKRSNSVPPAASAPGVSGDMRPSAPKLRRSATRSPPPSPLDARDQQPPTSTNGDGPEWADSLEGCRGAEKWRQGIPRKPLTCCLTSRCRNKRSLGWKLNPSAPGRTLNGAAFPRRRVCSSRDRPESRQPVDSYIDTEALRRGAGASGLCVARDIFQ